MIRGIGIDMVEIDRFHPWADFSPAQLSRIFTSHEIQYCCSNPVKIVERLAARFAVKEAFYKAYSATKIGTPLPFLTLCKCVEVYNNPEPRLRVSWNLLIDSAILSTLNLKTHVSISHTAKSAVAVVIIEE